MPKNNDVIQDHNTNKQKQNLKRFGIISAVIFAIIIVSTIIYIKSYGDDPDLVSSLFIQSIHVIILSAGLIGLGYCILILKTFDVKVDPELERNYKEMVKDLKRENTPNNMSLDNRQTEKKIDLFF